MKKEVKIVFVIILSLMLITFVMHIFKNHHKINYSINKNIKVEEEYIKNKESEYYLLRINVNDRNFIFSANNNFNKKKKILKDVNVLEKDKLLCIYPKLIDNTYLDIECNINNKLFSYDSIKDKYDLNELTNNNAKFNKDIYIDKYNKKDSYKDIDMYYDNFYDNENIIIYNYKDIIRLRKNKMSNINFSSFDVYNNDLGVLIGNNYLVPKYNKKKEIDTYYIIDILKEKTTEINFKKYKLSTNVYINGVVSNKLYIFDKSNITQYEIDPKKKKISRIGNNKNVKYYNGNWIDYNPYKYVKNGDTFKLDIDLSVDYKEIFDAGDAYYFYNSNNEFYKVYKNNLDLTIYLFKYNNFKEVSIINNKLYFINDNKLYRYDKYGLKTLLKRDEFKYNYKNIYGAYFN